MTGWLGLTLLGIAVVVCTALLIEALLGFLRASRGIDEDAVRRRLAEASGDSLGAGAALVRGEQGAVSPEKLAVPILKGIERLILQSDKPLTMRLVLLIAGGLSLVIIVALFMILPGAVSLLAIPLGIGAGPGAVYVYLANARDARVRRFEEQLPEAIDLIVRSLKVGHPLSVSLSVIAQELPDPIGREFRLAHDKVSYGLTVPDAFREMSDRVALPDLRYLIATLQIQEEAGGNLIETLTKLAAVIRERFRMFRKVKAITAEGRMSAWLLSVFPLAIGLAIRLVKPDYFDHALAARQFPVVAIITAVMLIVNILMMHAVTKIKV